MIYCKEKFFLIYFPKGIDKSIYPFFKHEQCSYTITLCCILYFHGKGALLLLLLKPIPNLIPPNPIPFTRGHLINKEYRFRIIILYLFKISKLSFDCALFSEMGSYLYREDLISMVRFKINIKLTNCPHRYFITLASGVRERQRALMSRNVALQSNPFLDNLQ